MRLWTSGPAKPKRNWRIIRMLQAGHSTADVAARFGISTGRVRQLRAYHKKFGSHQ